YSRVLTLAEIQADRATPIAPSGPADTTPPSNVTGLTATAVSATQINLSWATATDNIAVTGYRVERCPGAGCTNFAQIAVPTGTTFSDTGLTASSSYSYQVKAVDAAGNVSVNFSNVATATTAAAPPDTIPPTDPTNLTATAASSSQINLTWTASTDSGGLAGYGVERCQGVGCTNFVQIATPSTNSYSDTGLTAGTSYSYRIRAVANAGNSSNYLNISATTPGGGGGGASLVTALGMNEGSGTTLTDASGSGHIGTLVNGPLWVAGQATYGQALSFDGVNDVVSIANSGTYNFGTADFTIELWVKPNVLGGGQRHLVSKCAAAAFVTGCKELYLNGNQLLFGSYSTGDTSGGTIADTNWHHIALTFTDSTNTLRIYVDGVLTTTATKALEADNTAHVVTLGNMHGNNPFSGLLDEFRVYSRVLTLAEIQADRATPIAPSGPADTTPPSNVTGLTATAVSATQINLSWATATDNIAVTGYRVERCPGAGCTNFAQIAVPTGTTFSDTGLTASSSYSYQVKAVDAAGNVSVNFSNVATATTAAAPPDTIPPTDPTNLTATAASSSQINLTWTASTDSGGLAGYGVERCQGVGCTNFVQIATPSTNSYSDTGLTAGTSYSYRIRAVDNAGNSSNYLNISATTPGGGGGGASLVTALGMNEGSGTTLTDASGSGHIGTLVNGPLWVAGQATYGQALSFDGVNDVVSIANSGTYNFGTADFTIELWVKPNVLGGGQRHLVSKCEAAAFVTGCKELYLNGNQLLFGSYSTGDTSGGTIADTNWHHIALTFTDSTNTLRIYVDGVLTTTATKALEADNTAHVVTLGNMHGNNPFSGLLDEFRVYSRVLTLAEIQADRATPITP
ncbi:MAG: hypothetical protein E8D41_10790, partial [Nitrospira sp.]